MEVHQKLMLALNQNTHLHNPNQDEHELFHPHNNLLLSSALFHNKFLLAPVLLRNNLGHYLASEHQNNDLHQE